MKNSPAYLITIVGPTGIGKTSLSLALATHFKSEILSADSRQFYKEMTIGTAVPTEEELQKVKHHFIQDRSIHHDFNVGDYEKEVLVRLEQLFKNHRCLILVGGSGLYINAVLNGLDNFPSIDPSIRITLQKELNDRGIKLLQEELKLKDPKTYANIDLHNSQRLLRALEICRGTHKPYSFFIGHKKPIRNFIPIKIGLKADREIIYERINQRVDQMILAGLIDEVKNLIDFAHLNALQTVGYKEIFQHFNNEITLEEAISEIKKNSRRYAKRQLTWLRKDQEIKWFDHTTPVKDIINFLKEKLKSPV